MYKEAFNRLPDNYSKQNQTNNEFFYEVIYSEIEELKVTFEDIKASRDIDKAFGQSLDNVGGNVQELRGSPKDEVYRDYIKTKIIANLSQGDIETLNEVSGFLLGDKFLGFEETWKDEGYDDVAGLIAKIELSLSSIPSIINRVRAGGVRIYWEATAVNNLLKAISDRHTGSSHYPLCNTINSGTWWYQQNFGRVKSSGVEIDTKISSNKFSFPEVALIEASEKLYSYHQFAKQLTLDQLFIIDSTVKEAGYDYVKAGEILSGIYPRLMSEIKVIFNTINIKNSVYKGKSNLPETALVSTSEEFYTHYEFAKQLTLEQIDTINSVVKEAEYDYVKAGEILGGIYPRIVSEIKVIFNSMNINSSNHVGAFDMPGAALVSASKEFHSYHEFAKQLTLEQLITINNVVEEHDHDYAKANEALSGDYPDLMNRLKAIYSEIDSGSEVKINETHYPVTGIERPKESD